jgi:sugar phosphate isomerase/epimerase
MLSFSTCWNSGRHRDGGDMLREIIDLGFRNVELGHGIRISLMEGIQKMVERGNVNLTSLHNFCPLPIEVLTASPNCYEYTSHRKTHRERALKLTLQTIDFAARLGAPFVVLHLGRVPLPQYTHQLADLAEAGKMHSREYVRLKLKAVQEREKLAAGYVSRALEALKPIAEYAAAKNIHLGVESRESYEEVPTERELPGLLEEINSPFVGYWHDFGHVQIKENLGFLNHEEWLTLIRPRLFGCHLHDVEWPAGDHRAMFTGEIEYERLIPLLPPDTLFVLEMSPRRKKEEIVKAAEEWRRRYSA